jgi:ribosome-associated heat shock protein Hsp15
MLSDSSVRVDKWLWAVRIYKTRNQATESCRKGKVTISGQAVKPSRVVRIDDVIEVRKSPVKYSYRVLGLLGKRLSAEAVKAYIEDVTPGEELEKRKIRDTFYVSREKGLGRPTKKERRTLDKLKGNQRI